MRGGRWGRSVRRPDGRGDRVASKSQADRLIRECAESDLGVKFARV
jgi:hypothetical protein